MVNEEAREHLFGDFVSLPYVERCVEKTYHLHNENSAEDLGNCYDYGNFEVYEILQVAIEENWPEKIKEVETIDGEIQQLQARADFFQAYEMDTGRSTTILEKLYDHWDSLDPVDIQQPHQVVRILTDIRRKAIESSINEDTDRSINFKEDDEPPKGQEGFDEQE